jgi:hypothetical protein
MEWIERIEQILNEKSSDPHPVHLLTSLGTRYMELLSTFPFPSTRDLSSMNPDEITQFLKRDKFDIGKYRQITVFEAANRMASDLVLLEGLPLIAEKYSATNFKVLLGNHAIEQQGDFALEIDGKWWEGEAFSTAESFFHPKLSATRSKWNKQGNGHLFRFILFNTSARKKAEKPSNSGWSFCLQGEKVTVWERIIAT